MTEIPNDDLFSKPEKEYGENYQSHLLEQYKLFVQMADNISERRSKTNTFFLSVNSFLLTALGISTKLVLDTNIASWWLYVALAGGIVFAFTWFNLIRSYKNLNSSKFKVIHELEKKLPTSPYTKEWNIIKIEKKYHKLTNIESIVPIVFIVLYVVLIIGTSIG